MAIVVVSLDTESRQAVLTINGALIPTKEFNISQYIKYDTKDEIEVSFGYVIKSVDLNGLEERRQFYLPPSEEIAVIANAELNDDGFASKVLHDDEKAKADVVAFLKRDRNS